MTMQRSRSSPMPRNGHETLPLSLDYADPESVVRAAPARVRDEAVASAHILVVDEDAAVRTSMDALLRAAGFATSTAANGEAALSAVRRALPDLVLTHVQMPTLDGAELCQRLREIDRDLPVIVVTPHSSMQSVIPGLRAGVDDYLVKPFECESVLWCVERALTRRTEKRERAALDRALEERLVSGRLHEQQQAEAAARQCAQLSALLENLKDGVVIADPSGRIVMISDAARAILGIGGDAPATLDAFHAQEALDLDGRCLRNEQRPLMRALRGDRFLDYEVLHVLPNGERRRVLSTGTNVRDDQGNVVLGVVVFRDVTEQRLLEQQRDEYLGLVSHDLRNPLSSVSMCVSMLRLCLEKKVGTDAIPVGLLLKYAERAERNVERMTLMLEELTESTSLESPGVELRRTACDVRGLIANVVDSLDDTRARRIRIETDGAPPYEVLGDASRLERVVANLLTNALKYSAPGTPVDARLARRGSSVELDVIDRGIGLPPGSVRMIFAKYYRASGGRSKASGLGLGLYIAHRIVEAHGGRIEVSSELGKGSTFRLILPCSGAVACRPDEGQKTGALVAEAPLQ